MHGSLQLAYNHNLAQEAQEIAELYASGVNPSLAEGTSLYEGQFD